MTRTFLPPLSQLPITPTQQPTTFQSFPTIYAGLSALSRFVDLVTSPIFPTPITNYYPSSIPANFSSIALDTEFVRTTWLIISNSVELAEFLKSGISQPSSPFPTTTSSAFGPSSSAYSTSPARDFESTLALWARSFSQVLVTLDDKAYFRQFYFTLAELRFMTQVLKKLVFSTYWCSPANPSAVLSTLLGQLYDREDRRLNQLLLAHQNADFEGLESILEGGASVDLPTSKGVTPLLFAAQNGHLELVKLLAERDADVNVAARVSEDELLKISERGSSVDATLVNSKGTTPLLAAAQNGHLGIVTLLLELGASVDLDDNEGETPLNAASELGHLEIVRVLLEWDANVDLANHITGNTPLLNACHGSHWEIVKLLLQAGARTDLTHSEKGHSPLFMASEAGQGEIVEAILESGANVDSPNSEGVTPLFTAAHKGQLAVVKMLVERGARIEMAPKKEKDLTPLHAAASEGHTQVVKLLLQHGASIDMSDTLKCGILLAKVVQAGDRELVTLLLDRGMSVDVRSAGGVAPLFIAVTYRHLEIAKLLLGHGASVDVSNQRDSSALYTACQNGQTEMVKLLLENGATVDPPTRSRARHHMVGSPLFLACQLGHVAIVRLLLEYGAAIKSHGDGLLPLIAAAQRSKEIVRMLVDAGASLDAKECIRALKMLLPDRTDIAEIMLQNCTEIAQVAKAEPAVVHLVALSSSRYSDYAMKLIIDNGANLNWVLTKTNGTKQTALHSAVMTKQAHKVLLLMLYGADPKILYQETNKSKTVWELCEGDIPTYNALLHHWSPKIHKLYPKWVRDAIKCFLLVAKRLKWPFDRMLMGKITSFIAFGWYTLAVDSAPNSSGEQDAIPMDI